MIKTKFYLVLALVSILTFSCSKDDGETIETIQEAQVLEFKSKEAMEQEIDRVLELRSEKESMIMDKVFGNELQKISGNSDVTTQDFDQEFMIQNARRYHEEKIKDIYEERKERSFTSIQSIADEINSLRLIDPTKAEKVFEAYSTMLEKSDFSISTIFDFRKANVINANGEIMIAGKKEKFNQNNDIQQKDRDGKLKKEGVLAKHTIGSASIIITWHAGIRLHDQGFDTLYTQFACYLSVNGINVLYPGAFYYPDADSKATFSVTNQLFLCPTSAFPKFPSGKGSIVRENAEVPRRCTTKFDRLTGIAAGRFVVIGSAIQATTLRGRVNF